MRTHRPVLVFRGGGYEGCFYEWNAILFKPGAPHRPEETQPCVSGRAGKRVLSAAQSGLRSAVIAAKAEGDWHLCTTDRSWVKFDGDFNKGFVRAVCAAAQRECRCDRCKKWFDPDEIVHTGYRGNGGIGVQFDDNHCQECAEEEHEDYCAKFLWKYASMGTRIEAIHRHNEESVHPVSVFAARHDEAPVAYRFYAGEPELY